MQTERSWFDVDEDEDDFLDDLDDFDSEEETEMTVEQLLDSALDKMPTDLLVKGAAAFIGYKNNRLCKTCFLGRASGFDQTAGKGGMKDFTSYAKFMFGMTDEEIGVLINAFDNKPELLREALNRRAVHTVMVG